MVSGAVEASTSWRLGESAATMWKPAAESTDSMRWAFWAGVSWNAEQAGSNTAITRIGRPRRAPAHARPRAVDADRCPPSACFMNLRSPENVASYYHHRRRRGNPLRATFQLDSWKL